MFSECSVSPRDNATPLTESFISLADIELASQNWRERLASGYTSDVQAHHQLDFSVESRLCSQ